MSEPFIGEIRMFGGTFAPRGWALCDGQLLQIANNEALFSILGTTFGGDGRTTFALPDLRGRGPMHPGNGPGLSPRRLGQKGGAETATLTVAQIPEHNHVLRCANGDASTDTPVNGVAAKAGEDIYAAEANANMSGGAIANNGGGQPHNNLQPFTCVNFIMALVGLYPSRN